MSTRLQAYRLLIADVYELAGASRRTGDTLARALGQSAARWHVMSVLSGQPCTVAAAARRLGLARQGVQRVVNDLRRDGMVEVRANPSDRRAPLVELTASGQQMLAEIIEASNDDRGALLRRAGVSAEDLRQARAVLRALLGAFEPTDD